MGGSPVKQPVPKTAKPKGHRDAAWLDMLEQSAPSSSPMRSTACVRWRPAVKLGAKASDVKCVRGYRSAEWHKMLRAGSPVKQPVPKTAKPKGHRDAAWLD